MMALTHYNSLIKAHPAVTAALSSINTHIHARTHGEPNLCLLTQTHKHREGTAAIASRQLSPNSPQPLQQHCSFIIPATTLKKKKKRPAGEDF